MKKPSSLVILAAGGTGGHIFPAEALARELMLRRVSTCLFTDPRGGRFSAELRDVPVVRIPAASLGRSFFKKARGALMMMAGTVMAYFKLKAMKPALVVGFGGYPSVPTVFAAHRLGIPILLHEQNAVLGRANKVLAPLARRVGASFPHVAGLESVSPGKVSLVGTPVRPAICALHDKPYPPISDDAPLRLLVVGGSLGAKVFADAVPKAIKLLPESLRKRLLISQQCRADDLEAVRRAYDTQGIQAELASFFSDMPERLASCHLAICRSGASTVAELCAAGRPAILVPYPHALADEQKANAQSMAEAGAGWLIPENALTPEALAVRLESLFTRAGVLAKAAEAAKGLARLQAAQDLADLACGMIDIFHNRGENGGAQTENHSADKAA
ncbi:MAG TPA: undecaprenyldiphospho-muramoylpentapeptide beta-N-acetylglucosaminyltransferase [Alphaproteobacteria bacterium]|nr:undecaprenyldiphospho-muramoylpentapeptide beta-N-acetylglucosaminyltransferase [Alphaproteobacteria bacterium]